MARGDRGPGGVTGTAPTTGPDPKPRVVPRNHRRFEEIRHSRLTCVVVSRDSGYRHIPREPAEAFEFLDRDPKAKLLDLGDGRYRIERRPWPPVVRTGNRRGRPTVITSRETSWLAPGVLVAVTLDGHRYRGHIVERTAGRRWRVDLEGGLDDHGTHHLRGGGTLEFATHGPRRIEHLLSTAMTDTAAARAYGAYLDDLTAHPDTDPADVYARHHPEPGRTDG